MTECRMQCGSPAQRDGYCSRCRCRNGLTRMKYFWKPEHIAKLRWAHEATRAAELSERLRAVQQLTGFPRVIINKQSKKLGLSAVHRVWTETEKQYLIDHAGEMSATEIAKQLGRAIDTTAIMIRKLGFSARVRDGYTIGDICEAIGVSQKKVYRWLDHQFLTQDKNGRVSDMKLRRFLVQHSEEYDLRRVDQYWFKSMIFPKFGLDCRLQPRRADVPQQAEAHA